MASSLLLLSPGVQALRLWELIGVAPHALPRNWTAGSVTSAVIKRMRNVSLVAYSTHYSAETMPPMKHDYLGRVFEALWQSVPANVGAPDAHTDSEKIDNRATVIDLQRLAQPQRNASSTPERMAPANSKRTPSIPGTTWTKWGRDADTGNRQSTHSQLSEEDFTAESLIPFIFDRLLRAFKALDTMRELSAVVAGINLTRMAEKINYKSDTRVGKAIEQVVVQFGKTDAGALLKSPDSTDRVEFRFLSLALISSLDELGANCVSLLEAAKTGSFLTGADKQTLDRLYNERNGEIAEKLGRIQSVQLTEMEEGRYGQLEGLHAPQLFGDLMWQAIGVDCLS